jgi:hypothetical protein
MLGGDHDLRVEVVLSGEEREVLEAGRGYAARRAHKPWRCGAASTMRSPKGAHKIVLIGYSMGVMPTSPSL